MTSLSGPVRLTRSRGFRVVASLALLWTAGAAWNRHLNAAPQIAIPAPLPLPNPNAYDAFVHAAARRVEPPLDAWHPSGTSSDHTYTDADRQAMLTQNRPALGALHAALQLPNYQQPSQRSLGSFDRNYAAFRSLTRTLAFANWMHEQKGDYSGAVSGALDGIQFGVTVSKGGSYYSLMAGEAIEAISRKRLWGQIEHLDAAQSAEAARRLETIEAMRQPLSANFEEEKWIDLTQMREMLHRRSAFDAWRSLNT